MIIKIILGLTMVVLPFLAIIGFDCREPKNVLCIMSAALISIVAIYQGKLKPFKNFWIPIFMVFTMISYFFAPQIQIVVMQSEIGKFWVWKPLIFMIVMFLMLLSVYSLSFSKKDIKTLLDCLFWTGFITSVYVIAQYFSFDQFFMPTKEAIAVGKHALLAGSSLGNPAVAGAFIAMLLPITLYLKRPYEAIIMCIAIFLTDSQMAMGAGVGGLLFYLAMKGKGKTLLAIFLVGLTIVGLASAFILAPKNSHLRSIVEDSGRFAEWKAMVDDVLKPSIGIKKEDFDYLNTIIKGKTQIAKKDLLAANLTRLPVSILKAMDNEENIKNGLMTEEKIKEIKGIIAMKENAAPKRTQCFTGYSAGAFYYVYCNKHKSNFRQAHGEYIEVLYDLGLIGLLIFFIILIYIFNMNMNFQRIFYGKANPMRMALLASFFSICLNAIGFFPWHLGAIVFPTIFIVGLLHKEKLYDGD
jgi:hypothetical protein